MNFESQSPAPEVVEQLLFSLPEIEAIKIGSYSHLQSIQERVVFNEAETSVVNRALSLRAQTQLPFWDCVMLEISKTSGDFGNLISSASIHPDLSASMRSFKVSEIGKGRLAEYAEELRENGLETCITSEVELKNGELAHLPMMDFHAPPNSEGQAAVMAVCQHIFRGDFVLLESGKSFHAYGVELLKQNEFISFLGNSLLFAPIIDRAYIAHQLIEGRCALRISGTGKTQPRLANHHFKINTYD